MSGSRRSDVLFLVLILLIVVRIFLPCLSAEFLVWDDEQHVWGNPLIQTLSPLSLKMIFSTPVLKTYIPLTILSFALEYHFFHLNPFFYHLDNVLLHLVVVALIYILARRLNFNSLTAGLTAIFFGIHPMHVESVAWVTERKDVLYSVFYLASILFYLSYIQTKSWAKFSLSLLMGLLSILAKPMALSLPVVLFLFDWLYDRGLPRRVLLEKIPFVLILAPMAWITYSLNARVPEIHFPQSLTLWIWTCTFYLWKFFFPTDLSPAYNLPHPITWSHGPFLWSGLAFVFFLGAAWYFRRQRWFIFALAYYFLSIFFLLRLDEGKDANLVADRFMYLPSLGLCLLIGLSLARLWDRVDKHRIGQVAGILVLAFIVAGLGLTTWRQCHYWKDDLTLWTYALHSFPTARMAYNNLGGYYSRKDDYERALFFYHESLRLNAYDYQTLNDMGLVYFNQGRYEEALQAFDRSTALNPGFGLAYINRGAVYIQQNHYDWAIAEFTRCMEAMPDFYAAYVNRGNLYAVMGKYTEALQDLNKAVELRSNDPLIYLQRARVYTIIKDFEKAKTDYAKILQLDPKNKAVRNFYNQIEALLRKKKALSP